MLPKHRVLSRRTFNLPASRRCQSERLLLQPPIQFSRRRNVKAPSFTVDYLSGYLPVDVPYRPISAFLCSQIINAPEPARFLQSHTKLPCLSTRNTRQDSSPDTAGDTPPLRRKAAGNHSVIASPGSVRSISGRRCDETTCRTAGWPSAELLLRAPGDHEFDLFRGNGGAMKVAL